MGNCLYGGMGDPDGGSEVIKVITSNGGIMEFYGPITVESITDEFPGHSMFRSHDLFWQPIPHQEVLLPSKSYYLLPLNQTTTKATTTGCSSSTTIVQIGHVRSKSVPSSSSLVAPYRMSFDSQGMLRRSLYHMEGWSRYNSKYNNSKNNSNSGGIWKVKLVISPQQLLDILSQEASTQELIESVRTVAKCGGVSSSSSSVAFSDQWSISSSRKGGSCKKDEDDLLEMI